MKIPLLVSCSLSFLFSRILLFNICRVIINLLVLSLTWDRFTGKFLRASSYKILCPLESIPHRRHFLVSKDYFKVFIIWKRTKNRKWNVLTLLSFIFVSCSVLFRNSFWNAIIICLEVTRRLSFIICNWSQQSLVFNLYLQIWKEIILLTLWNYFFFIL